MKTSIFQNIKRKISIPSNSLRKWRIKAYMKKYWKTIIETQIIYIQIIVATKNEFLVTITNSAGQISQINCWKSLLKIIIN